MQLRTTSIISYSRAKTAFTAGQGNGAGRRRNRNNNTSKSVVKHPPPAWEPEAYIDSSEQDEADKLPEWNEEDERILRARIREAIEKIESMSGGLTDDDGGGTGAQENAGKKSDGAGRALFPAATRKARVEVRADRRSVFSAHLVVYLGTMRPRRCQQNILGC